MKKNNKGFSVVEGLLLFVIFGLVVSVGWYVTNNRATVTLEKSGSGTTTRFEPTERKETEAERLYREYQTPTETAEIKSEIISALDKYCQTDFVIKIKDNYPDKILQPTLFKSTSIDFDSSGTYRRKDNHAALSASCESSQITDQERTWSGFVALLRKTNIWQVTSTDQMAPACNKVDGLGYPPEIVSTCYDGNNTRAPL